MSKSSKDKIPNSPNTLLHYFARSPASAKKITNPSTPTSALASKSASKVSSGTPKAKSAIKKELEVVKEEKKAVVPTVKDDDDDEEEIISRKKRRRVIVFDDPEDDDGSGENEENRQHNNNNDHDVETGTKRFELSSFERPDEVEETSSNAKITKKKSQDAEERAEEQPDEPVQKKIKLEPENNGTDELKTTLDEPTVWAHQKLDFLKPNKIKDIHGHRPGHEKYDGRTLFVPESFKTTLTPAMHQWWELKSNNFDCVLFFKVGKFYELYHMDAEVGVKELGFSFMKGEFAHSGFPEQAYDRMSTTLVEKGYKVARVEQTETPEMMQDRCKSMRSVTKFDRVVRREICQVTLKGTEVFGQQVRITANHQPRYMMAIVESAARQALSGARYGVCFIDTSIGRFHVGEFEDDHQQSRLLTLLSHYPPVLMLHERNIGTSGTQRIFKTLLANVKREALTNESQFWSGEKTLKYLAENFYGGSANESSKWPQVLRTLVDDTDSLGLTPKESHQLALKALGGCVWYLQRCLLDQQVLSLASFEEYVPLDEQRGILSGNDRIADANANRYMVLDSITLNNLKVVGMEGSLIERMDHCCTKFGKRLFHHWVCAPSCERTVILERQEAVSELIENVSLLQDVRQVLGQLPDLERLLAQIHGFGNAKCSRNHPAGRAILYEEHSYGKKKIGDFIATLNGFRSLLALPELFSGVNAKLLVRLTQTPSTNADGSFPKHMETQIKFFDNAFDHEKAMQGGVIAPEKGVDEEYDAVEQDIESLKRELEEYREEQSKYFGCNVVYFGNDKKRFQLEVPESRAKKATSEYTLEGTRKGKNAVKRFHTDETRQFLRQMMQLEDRRKAVLKDLARRIFEKFSLEYDMWKSCVELVATLDVLTSLAVYARSEGAACVPELVEKKHAGQQSLIELEEGIHPCIGADAAENYIPNGITMGAVEKENGASLVLLTGPNMGGKSTLMRQVGLLAIMAQIGSRIPAQSCRMTLIDRIFTRLGASDDIMAGHSTFLVELNETSAILKHATRDSLVLLDELGRGTATYDGTAVAGAVVHFLADLKCRTIFSTHYHNLVDNFHDDPRITLGHMACMVENEESDDPTQETVTFLYRYTDGACPKSYGFNAAKLAGMPSAIIKRAYELSKTVEAEALKRKILMKLLTKQPQADIKDLVVKLKSSRF
ncbi:probable DNA mismatch repair protein Msh6 [Anopheles ziemanni]|uniref:probable DNA mismatch repair protein Msh6 n=1 Tax=Anopheles coustani TaxID=139045 RepID=UPI00265ADB55|nr:probable DNA mismatch repair protein Msh6 [Anopheles coustani]XP_058173269.1 probable DNA mismatch repair protein Msh6 [Anopheles ziemanni]